MTEPRCAQRIESSEQSLVNVNIQSKSGAGPNLSYRPPICPSVSPWQCPPLLPEGEKVSIPAPSASFYSSYQVRPPAIVSPHHAASPIVACWQGPRGQAEDGHLQCPFSHPHLLPLTALASEEGSRRPSRGAARVLAPCDSSSSRDLAATMLLPRDCRREAHCELQPCSMRVPRAEGGEGPTVGTVRGLALSSRQLTCLSIRV